MVLLALAGAVPACVATPKDMPPVEEPRAESPSPDRQEEPKVAVAPAVVEPAVAEPAVAEPAVAETAVVEPAVAEPAVAEPGPPSLPLVGPMPAFVALRYRAERRTALRAHITEIGSAYAPGSLSPLSIEGRPYSIFMTVPVLDADPAGSPRRLRVLCEDESARVGLALDVSSFEAVVRAQTFVSPTRQIPQSVKSKTPGLRLAAGTTIGQVSEPEDGILEIGYGGLLLEATGFVPTEAVDLVFSAKELEDDRVRNGQLLRNVEFLDAPDGAVIAKTTRAPRVANEMHIRTLGAAKDGHILVRYRESDAFIVGWVAVDDVETYTKKKFKGGGGYGFGSGGGFPTDIVELDRGTLLVAPGVDEVVGVITSKEPFLCGTTCGDAIPKVTMRACGHRIAVYAVPPDAVRASP